MFEYADPIDIMDLVLMSIASFVLFIKEDRENLLYNTNKKAGKIIAVMLFFAALILTLYSSHKNKTLIDTNSKAFKKGALLKCRNGSGDILATKKNGWHLSKRTLYKNDYIVNVQGCSVLDKKDFKETDND